jgi:hypothetical protein
MAVGVARSRSPLGPFVKQEQTVLRRDEHWKDPGAAAGQNNSAILTRSPVSALRTAAKTMARD